MKKALFGMILNLVLFLTVAYAGDMRTGEVLKMDKQFITIEDFDTGKPVTLRHDAKTKIKGTLQGGALVEFQEKGGRAMVINVIVEEEEPDSETEDAQETVPKTNEPE